MAMTAVGARSFRAELWATSALAAPLVIAQLGQVAFGVVTTRMLGSLGPVELAGGALAGLVFSTTLILCVGVVSGAGILVAHAHGRGDHDAAARVARQGLWLAVGCSLVAIASFAPLRPILVALGQPVDVVARAMTYLDVVRWAFPAALAFATLRQYLAGVDRPVPAMVVAIVGVAFLYLGNRLVLAGAFGGSWTSIAGVGAATASAYVAQLVLLIAIVAATTSLVGRPYAPRRDDLVKVLRLGVPIGLIFGLESGLFTMSGLFAGRLGSATLAAHQIVVQTCYVTFMIPSGIGQAATIRVAHAAAVGDTNSARRAGVAAASIGIAFMTASSLVFFVAPERIIALYVDVDRPENAEVVRIARTLLPVAAAFQIVDGVQGIATGALRGLGDTRTPLLLGVGAYWCVGATAAGVLAFRLNLGAIGIWWGLALGLGVAAVLFSVRFFRLLNDRHASEASRS